MSFWVYLTELDGKTIQVEKHAHAGGSYAMGGTNDAELNITYNYAPFYFTTIHPDEGIRWLNNRTAASTLPRLEIAIESLTDDISMDYWEATEGNAKKALMILKAFAEARPDGIWKVD